MNIQIIGTKRSQDTRKTERYFKERGVAYQFVDLEKRALSRGELENIAVRTGTEELMDTGSAAYRKRGLEYMAFDVFEELLEDPSLLKIPIVRAGKDVSVGYAPELWSAWLKNA